MPLLQGGRSRRYLRESFPRCLDPYPAEAQQERASAGYLLWLKADSREPIPVLKTDDYRVSAIGVTHGPVPALAYRIDVGDQRLVFSGDLNGDDAVT